MAEVYSTGLERENEPSKSVDSIVVRKKFRVTMDVEATLAAEPLGGTLAPEDVLRARALMERLMARPEVVDRLLRCRALEAARQAGNALEVEYGWDGGTEHELLGPIFAELAPEARAYFTEELEDGASAYYFDGCGGTVERASLIEIDNG
jgi:hypothetical protein